MLQGAAVIRLGAGVGLCSRVRGNGKDQEVGDAATLWSGSDTDDKKVEVLLFSQKGEARGGESAWNGRMVGAIILPYLGALVDDFVVLGVETGQMLEALTSSPPPTPPRLGCSSWGHGKSCFGFCPGPSVCSLVGRNPLRWDFGDFWGLPLYMMDIQRGLSGHWGCCVL